MNHPEKECKCTPRQVKRYRRKISGPVLDRIDIQVKIPYVDIDKVSEQKDENDLESSAEIRKRVVQARQVQKERFANDDIHTNSEMKNEHRKEILFFR